MTETGKALAFFASASLRALFLPSVPSTTRPIASQRSAPGAPRSPRPQTLCFRPIRLASGAIPRASAAKPPTCSYKKSRSGGNPRQEPRLLSHRPFALMPKYRSAQKGNGCHGLAVLPQPRRSPLSFESNHRKMFSFAARSAIR